MTPLSKKRLSPRYKYLFNIGEILLHGLPFWIAAPIIGWYIDGWLGLKSSLIGLLILGLYVGSTGTVTKKSQKISAKKAVAFAVGGFWVRLIGLWIVVFSLSRFLKFNLTLLLLTVAVGFTVILAMSVKNWLQD